jgi:hypothetical protein
MKRPREVLQPRWGIYRLRGKRAERMCFSVQARDSEEAIERAIKEYEIPERERRRISVRREA